MNSKLPNQKKILSPPEALTVSSNSLSTASEIHSPLLRIGEVSAQSGLPIKTIRFYCDEGLIIASSRSEAGYRLFNQQVFDDLNLIKTLKILDTPLNQIRSLLHSRRSGFCHCQDLKNSLLRKVRSLDDQIKTLQQMHASLQELLSQWQDCGGTKPDNIS
jgi:MerR family copper efflux transcriptional regulator